MRFILIFILLFSSALAGPVKNIGENGKESEVKRIIKVVMYDNFFQPNIFNVKKNETVKFIVKNKGELVHEFNIATKRMHLNHQKEMERMVENEILLADKIDKEKMKKLAKTDHAMAHSHSNSVLLEPGETKVFIWKFNNQKKVEAACNVPGHYQAGMIAKINDI